MLKHDLYDKNRLDSKWTAGPNEVFYRVMSRDGDVYQQFIGPNNYRFVQQLEIDVCPVRDGWLDALIAEANAASMTMSVISGARVEGDTVCSTKKSGAHECKPASAHPAYIRQHINGNALYRMGDELQALLDSARSRHGQWPFDLAAYLAANATSQLHLLRPSKLIHNRVVPVHAALAYSSALYDPQTYFVHCSSNLLKPTQAGAAFATLAHRSEPVILVGACQSTSTSILTNLHYSLQRLGIRNVVWSAPSGGEAVSRVQNLMPRAFVESAERHPHSTRHSGCIPPLDVIEQLIRRQHSVFYMDGNAVIVGDLTKALDVLDGNATHFASGAVQSHGNYYDREPHAPRYMFTSKAFFMPPTAASLGLIKTWRTSIGLAPNADADAAINAGARCSTIASCEWNGAPLRLLSPAHFVSGPNLMKQWPSAASIDTAVAFIDVASQAGAKVAPLSDDRVRFRLQYLKKWHLPRSTSCCERVLMADDASVGENATTVRNYVDLLFRINRTATQAGIQCVVVPAVVDSRTGERMAYEVILDPTLIFQGLHVYPTIFDAPICPQFGGRPSVILNGSSDATGPEGWRSWPVSAFAPELRQVLTRILQSSTAISSATCVDESERSLAEAALHVLRGSAPAILQAGPSTGRVTYVAGNWRVLNAHVERVAPRVLTLLSPSLYPGTTPTAVYTSFGLRAQYPRLGEDIVMDVLDALVCRLAGNFTKSEMPALEARELYAGLLEFVHPDVLDEELGLVQRHIAELAAVPAPPPPIPGTPPIAPPAYLIPLDSIDNNGFSNTVNAAQVLAYVANKTGLKAAMVSLSIRHRKHEPRPWSDVISNVAQFYDQVPSLTPSLWAMLRHPSLLVEVLDGYALPAGSSKLWSHNTTCRKVSARRGKVIKLPCMSSMDAWGNISVSHHSPRLFQRMHVAWSAADREELLLHGHDAVSGKRLPYLGLSDEEIVSAVATRNTFRGRDIAFRPFRAFNFQNEHANHVAFAESWRAAFKPAASLQEKADGVLRGLAANFTCYHARVADEFLTQHRVARPHFGADNVFRMIDERIEQEREANPPGQNLPTVYITSDLVDPVKMLSTGSSPIATSCRAFGCSDKDCVGWAIIDRLVCASAATFLGNTYSTFTLAICAIRNDQKCRDLFGQALGDGRLLF